MLELALTELAGRHDAPHLLIVGPSLGTAVEPLWRPCAEKLGEHYQVLGWDLPGHGRTTPATGAFTMGELAEVVRRLAVRHAEGRPAWYAGVSMGGAVGFELALNPGPFRVAAALASAPKIGDRMSWRERAELVRRAGTVSMVAASARRWFGPTFARRNPRAAEDLLAGLPGVDDRSYAWACEALARFDRTSVLRQVEAPLLVAAGVHDVVLPPAEVKALVDHLHGLEFRILPHCGHLPPIEQPERVAHLLHDYIERKSRPNRSQRLIGELHAAMSMSTMKKGLE